MIQLNLQSSFSKMSLCKSPNKTQLFMLKSKTSIIIVTASYNVSFKKQKKTKLT